ncbi:hypothetical protein [Methylopila sp. 73B]|uniref:hypothetical protein n=1 Tax=Methylopila sp. 73B TaxID=1120792 RepID=UPI0012DEBBCA|nr:hypothetical protein [Methylopila sp. 73B]
MFVRFEKKDGKISGHMMALERDQLSETRAEKSLAASLPDKISDEVNIESILRNFDTDMEVYQGPLELLFYFNAKIGREIVTEKLVKFVTEKSHSRELGGDFEIFEIDDVHIVELIKRSEEIVAWGRSRRELPKIAIIGMIATLDDYIARLAKVVCINKSSYIFGKEKTVALSDILTHSNLDELKEKILSEEVERLMRDGHDSQVQWFEKALNAEIIKNYPLWPEFMEICARRNLFTHTSGVVSGSYVALGKKFGFAAGVTAGTKLSVDSGYYRRSVHVLYDFYFKLAHLVWRKLDLDCGVCPNESLNIHSYKLVVDKKYNQAIDILEYGLNIRGVISERTKRMMAINLANSYKMIKEFDKSKEVLSRFDWTAVSTDFKICVCAIEGRIPDLISLMETHGRGSEDAPVDYENWPVFREARRDAKFREAFKAKFGIPIKIKSPRVGVDDEALEGNIEAQSAIGQSETASI